MKLRFLGAEDFDIGIRRLSKLLDFELSDDGFLIKVVKSERIGAVLMDGEGIIYYKEKIHFFRALGLFIEQFRNCSSFEIYEDIDFDTAGVMIDASRNGVMKTDTLCSYLDYLAVMGYNMVMMYTEDTYTIPERPYFGYMRGRYTYDEIKLCDDYAYEYGIEMIPCIELYGHMERYLKWPEAAGVRDTRNILLADEEETYELIELMIKNAIAPYRSDKIHIGMDEADEMGRGVYMDKHGYVPQFEIFNRHMKRLMDIINKYGLKPLMWSDMYFRIGSKEKSYHDENIVISPDIIENIPDEMELVYWHYGEIPNHDDYMIKKHVEIGRKVMYAGGLWSWSGHMPENHITYESVSCGLEACRKYNVREMMLTIWGNDGYEMNIEANLLPLSFVAEKVYNKKTERQYLKKRFEFCTGGDYDAFWDMSSYHNIFGSGEKYDDYNERFRGKCLFWQDPLESLFDLELAAQPMSSHYRKHAEYMRQFKGKWEHLYKYSAALFQFLSLKTMVCEKLKPAYDQKDFSTLSMLAACTLPELEQAANEVHQMHKRAWHMSFKGFGWSLFDIRYGGMIARIRSTQEILRNYLSGKINRIDELEEPRLPYHYGAYLNYNTISTTSYV